MRVRSGFFIAIAAFWPTIALPQQALLSGNELYEDCLAARGGEKQLTCASYIMGIADALQLTKQICMPKGAVARQAVDVVTNYLRTHQEVRTYSAPSITGVALREAFRCAP